MFLSTNLSHIRSKDRRYSAGKMRRDSDIPRRFTGAFRAAQIEPPPAEREAGPIISVFAPPVDSVAPFFEAPVESEGAPQIAAPRGKTPNAAPWRGVIKVE